MRALTIKNPWADLIAEGIKTIELRSWSTSYRGDVLVIAGKSYDKTGAPWGQRGLAGHALCVVTLDDVKPAGPRHAERACVAHRDDLDWSRLFAWSLSDVRRVEPSAVRGFLGLVHWPRPIS